ncbi:hypothetical protein [Arcobacter sp.]|uniref:hypothetical protein n=1 Tax=Arcobacter TaxID=28196 RepID=UPI002A7634EF|nr:hypothetical protein [Arcobacter sp.]MDY3203850.1 hypothetical protein [Arcobacter sp.]
MGMCKSCGVVYSALIMKDGYCKDCKPELFTEEEKIQIDNNNIDGISYNEDTKVEKTKVNKSLVISLSIIGISVISYFIYNFFTTPSNSTIEKLASYYMPSHNLYLGEKFKILNSYEDKGKLIYVLEIYGGVCEMPVVKTSRGWIATSMNCNN